MLIMYIYKCSCVPQVNLLLTCWKCVAFYLHLDALLSDKVIEKKNPKIQTKTQAGPSFKTHSQNRPTGVLRDSNTQTRNTLREALEKGGTPLSYFPEMIPQASGDHVMAPTPAHTTLLQQLCYLISFSEFARKIMLLQ